MKDYRWIILLIFWASATVCLGGVAQPYERWHVLLATLTAAYLLRASLHRHPPVETATLPPGGPVAIACISFLLLIALFQLIPLPGTLLSWLSPLKYFTTFETLAKLGIQPQAHGYPISVDPGATFAFFGQAFVFCLLVAGCTEAMRSQEVRKKMAWGMATVSATIGFFGMAHRFSGSEKMFWFLTRGWTFFGPYVSANHAGALLAVGGAIALSLMYRRQSTVSQVVLSIFFFLCASGLLHTGSRAAVLALGVTALLQMRLRLMASVRDPAAKKILIPAITVTIVLALWWQAPSISRLGSTRERFQTGTELRPEIWSAAVNLWKQAPVLGVGFGAFPKASPIGMGDSHFLKVEHVENDYLETLTNGGLIGWLLSMVLLFFILRRIFRTLQSVESATSTRAFAMGTVAFLLNGIFVFHAPLPAHQIFFAILLGGLFSGHRFTLLKSLTHRKAAFGLCTVGLALGVAATLWPRSGSGDSNESPLLGADTAVERRASSLIHRAEAEVAAARLKQDPLEASALYAFAAHDALAGDLKNGALALDAAERVAPFELKWRSDVIDALGAAGALTEALQATLRLLDGPYPLEPPTLLRLRFNAAYFLLRLGKDAQMFEHLKHAERIDAKDWRIPLLRSISGTHPEALLLESWKRSTAQHVGSDTWDHSLETLLTLRPKSFEIRPIIQTIGPHRSDIGLFVKRFSRFLPGPISNLPIRLDAQIKSPRLLASLASIAASSRWIVLVDPFNDPETIDVQPKEAHAELDVFYLPVDILLLPKEISFRMVVASNHRLSTQLVLLVDGKMRITSDPPKNLGGNRWELTFRNAGARLRAPDGSPARVSGVGFTPLEHAGRYSIGPIELFVDSMR